MFCLGETHAGEIPRGKHRVLLKRNDTFRTNPAFCLDETHAGKNPMEKHRFCLSERMLSAEPGMSFA